MNGNRLRAPSDRYLTERTHIITLLEPLSRGLTDDDARAVLFVQRLETRSEIHRIANDRIARDVFRPDDAGDHLAAVDADSNLESRPSGCRPLLVEGIERRHDGERRFDRVIRVIAIVEGRTEERHDHIANELVDGSVVREEDRNHEGEVLVQ